MIVNGKEIVPVTDEPRKLAALRAEDDSGAGSSELAQYAVEELGLRPPRLLADGSLPNIIEHWPAGAAEGILVWGLHEMPEHDPDDDCDESGAGWAPAGWTPENGTQQ